MSYKDSFEDEVDEQEKIIESAMELCEFIEAKIDNEPSKGKLHSIWKKETNALIDEYNTRFGKVYTHVK